MSNALLAGALWSARRLLVGAVGTAAAVALAAATVAGTPGDAGALAPTAVRPATVDARPEVRPGKRSTKRPARSSTRSSSKSAAKRSSKASTSRSAKKTKAARHTTTRAGRRGESRSASRASARAHNRPTARDEARPAVSMAALTAPLPVVTIGGPAAAPAAVAPVPARFAPDTQAGRSGKLRARWGLPSASGLFSYLRRFFGDSAAAPGVYYAPEASPQVAAGDAPRPFTYIAMLPFAEKVGGRIGPYRIGFWPGELGRALRGDKYGTPAGFIQVTPDNAETAVSEHFRLRDFLTHDQARVWPKYLVLDPALVDKLELVIDDLRSQGYKAERLQVMSGFRTPQYNQGGGDPRGRAEQSRHQYGDAADVWVENGDGTMADLTGDGRVDARDAAVLAESAERVEARHPELVGGVGVYRATGAHGPFVHIDTRGERARWGRG